MSAIYVYENVGYVPVEPPEEELGGWAAGIRVRTPGGRAAVAYVYDNVGFHLDPSEDGSAYVYEDVQNITLTADEAAHPHTVGGTSLEQVPTLAVQDTSHGHEAEEPTVAEESP